MSVSRTTKASLALCAVLWLGAGMVGCSSGTGPCREETVTQDVIFDSPFRETQQANVTRFRELGYECSGETLYDNLGRGFGTRYTCTRCR